MVKLRFRKRNFGNPFSLLNPQNVVVSSTSHRLLCSSSDSENGVVSISPNHNHHLPSLEPSNDADSISSILFHHHNPFHAMESSFQLHDLSLSSHFLYQTFLCLKHSSKIALAFFHYSKSLPSPPLSMTSYNILIDILAKVRQFDVVWQLIVEMDGSAGVKPNSDTFLILIHRRVDSTGRPGVRRCPGLCRDKTNIGGFPFLTRHVMKVSLHLEERFERTIRNAENVFDEMCERGIEPDAMSFSIVLHVYSRAHKPEMSVEKLREMREKGVSPTVATYTSVVKCLCSCGLLEDAEELLEQMVRDRISPSAGDLYLFL